MQSRRPINVKQRGGVLREMSPRVQGITLKGDREKYDVVGFSTKLCGTTSDFHV